MQRVVKEPVGEELAHIQSFHATRPDWPICVLAERIYDEMEGGGPTHKYQRAHPYITGMKFVMDRIVKLAPCKVFDIGSPITQNVALAAIPGVEVTVLDVRDNDDARALGLSWMQSTATRIPLPSDSCDIVTSMWVMGHVGDGRYGDDFQVDGDLKMLSELHRVTKPGGTAIIGPGLIDDAPGNIFNLHRIYTWPWLGQAFTSAGFEIVEAREFAVSNEIYIKGADVERRDGRYGVAVLRKR
jgi:SAM-dependent methyltransferase